MAKYTTEAQLDGFAVQLKTGDFGDLVTDPTAVTELVALLDRYMVLHVKPQVELTKPVMGTLALALGFPVDRRTRRGGPAPGSVVTGFEFVGDFGAKAQPNPPTPRIPSYIESLHYDGISGYSMQASFNVPPTTPNLWCDMRAAYRDLPKQLRKVVDTHAAMHAVIPPPGTPLAEFPNFDAAKAVRRPLVIKHPRTREPLLYLPKNPASTIEGMSPEAGRAVLHELWAHVNTSQMRYASTVGHNELVVWDGLGTTHTNPAYPRDRDRTIWFLIVPGKSTEVEPYFA